MGEGAADRHHGRPWLAGPAEAGVGVLRCGIAGAAQEAVRAVAQAAEEVEEVAPAHGAQPNRQLLAAAAAAAEAAALRPPTGTFRAVEAEGERTREPAAEAAVAWVRPTIALAMTWEASAAARRGAAVHPSLPGAQCCHTRAGGRTASSRR